jgi:hypothetical protein
MDENKPVAFRVRMKDGPWLYAHGQDMASVNRTEWVDLQPLYLAAPPHREVLAVDLARAAEFVMAYATVIRECPVSEIARYHYLPEVEQMVEQLHALDERLRAAGGGS